MQDLFTDNEIRPELAPKHTRIFASILDYTLYLIILNILWGKWYQSSGNGFTIGVNLDHPNPLGTILFWLVILPLPEAVFGQTLGKRLFKVKVLGANYDKASYGQCIVRHLFDIIDWLPFFGILGMIVSSTNKNKQRIGDLVAKTIIVDNLHATSKNPESSVTSNVSSNHNL